MDVKRFFKFKFWVAGLISMNIADIAILALVFSRMITRLNYFYFFLPGIVILALFASAFTIGREVHMEMRRLYHHYLLSLPLRDLDIVIGRAISGAVRGLMYSSPLLLLTLVIAQCYNLTSIALIILIELALSLGISSFSILLAGVISNFDMYVTARGFVYFLLMFNSTIFYPIEVFKMLPSVFYAIALCNPISYGADALRRILYHNALPTFELLYVSLFSLLFTVISSAIYLRSLRK